MIISSCEKKNSSFSRTSKIKLLRTVQRCKKSTFESKEIRSLDFGPLSVLPALKRRLLKKISSVAYWFLVQISAFVGIRKLPRNPMLTASTEKLENLSLGRIVELP